jgi:hypothetical protein
MPLSTIEPGPASFQLPPLPCGVHRTVIEGLLPSQVRIPAHPRQNTNCETNMFRHATGVPSAKTVQFPRSPVARLCSRLPQIVLLAQGREVIQ